MTKYYEKCIEWLRKHLRWEVSGAIVGILAGVVGSTLLSVGAYITSEWCFISSAIILILWALSLEAQRWVRGSLAAVVLSAALLLVYDIKSAFNKQELSEDP